MKKLLALCLTVVLCLCCLASCGSSTVKNEWFSDELLSKANKVILCISGDAVILDSNDEDFTNVNEKVTTMLNSVQKDPNALEQPKMICDDFTVENEKSAWDIWFEFHFEEGKYKKIFFTMNTEDTQTIWIYATSTESYDDGKLLKYYSCDCKDVLTLLDSYNAE